MMLSFRRFLFVALLAAVAQGVAVNSAQGAFTVDFDAVPTNDFVNGFYNGGTSSGGASGPNLGVDFLAGDWFTPTGFGQTSQPNSAFSQSGSGSVNVAAGFTSQFGFTYGAFSPTTISIWSGLNGTGTLLFVDEIHRFNKAQQDGFLPHMEDGTILLVGATTENPSFELNAALLSRAQVIILERLTQADLERLAQRAEHDLNRPLPLTPDAREALIEMADGDGRGLLNLIEQIAASPTPLTRDQLTTRLMRRAAKYDKSGEEHYNLISALHKSIRGSDPDAALYWFARMLDGGEDPRFLARRLTRMAVEDVGLADPQAQNICLQGWQTYERLGSPEGELALAQAVIYLALAPKSNAAYLAFGAARDAAKHTGSQPPPLTIRNAPTKLMKDIGYGADYQYDHDAEDAFSGQNYFPDGMKRPVYYTPPERGFERDLKKRIDYFAKLRAKRHS